MANFDPTEPFESTFDLRAREARRLAARVEYEAKHGEPNHRMSRDEATLAIVALRYLAAGLSGDDAVARVGAILKASKQQEMPGV